MVRPSLARGAIIGLGAIALFAACSKSEPASQSVSEPAQGAATATPSPAASAAAPGAPPVYSPTATAPPAAPPAPVVVVPPDTASLDGPSHAPGKTPPPSLPKAQPAPAPTTTPHASKPSPRPKADDEGLHATSAPSLGVKKVAVLANNHYTCSSTEKRDNVAAFAEPRGARISIVGQGPCPGEVHDWSAQVTQARVDVQGTHGSASKCRCVGSGELVLRGLEPGTYDIAVNGGFDRPIATRITVLQ